MTTPVRTRSAGAAVISGLITALVALWFRFPWWLSVALIVIISFTAFALTRAAAVGSMRPADTVPTYRPASPPPPRAEPGEHQISELPLRTTHPDYRIRFSATARWRPASAGRDSSGTDPAQLATAALVGRAHIVTSTTAPLDHPTAQHQLAVQLATPQQDPTGQLEVWADDVRLSLPEQDAARLRALSELSKDGEVWERHRDQERGKRAYLTQDVLSSTGSAVVWWLARNDTQIESTVGLIGPLAQLSAAATGLPVPEQFRHLVPTPLVPTAQAADLGTDGSIVRVLAAAMDRNGFDDAQRVMLGRRIADALGGTGLPAAADLVRLTFDPPAPADNTDDDPADGDPVDDHSP
jgi:hypothetical protein